MGYFMISFFLIGNFTDKKKNERNFWLFFVYKFAKIHSK